MTMLRSLLTFALLLCASPAVAQWHLGVEALTDVPMSAGGRVAVEGPERIRLSTALGVLPGAYVDVINEVAIAAGGYDDTTAEVIGSALSESLVWRTHVGWRPFADYGLAFDAGYTLAALGGGLTGGALLAAVIGQEPPEPPGGASDRSYSVASALHLIDVEIGWEWFVWEGLWLRAALGGSFTVASATTVEPDFDPQTPAGARAVSAFASFGEAYLDDIYTSYVHTVVISVGAGYRFF